LTQAQKNTFIEIVIPDTVIINSVTYQVTSIEDDTADLNIKGVFSNFVNLAKVTIPKTVINIGIQSFFNCNKLSTILNKNNSINMLPDSLITIGQGAFANCFSLALIQIPESVTLIGVEAFFKCSNLGTINFLKKNPTSALTFGTDCFSFIANIPFVNYFKIANTNQNLTIAITKAIKNAVLNGL
jgi:BspA type Leucine rich repeat region (6 copies)